MKEELKIPANFDNEDNSLLLSNTLCEIEKMQELAKSYAKAFVESQLKTAKEICEMIPNTLSELYRVNWLEKSLIQCICLKLEYNRISNTYSYFDLDLTKSKTEYHENKSLFEILHTISGENKVYFLDFNTKTIHLNITHEKDIFKSLYIIYDGHYHDGFYNKHRCKYIKKLEFKRTNINIDNKTHELIYSNRFTLSKMYSQFYSDYYSKFLHDHYVNPNYDYTNAHHTFCLETNTYKSFLLSNSLIS